jgi:hypothetical protein
MFTRRLRMGERIRVAHTGATLSVERQPGGRFALRPVGPGAFCVGTRPFLGCILHPGGLEGVALVRGGERCVIRLGRGARPRQVWVDAPRSFVVEIPPRDRAERRPA